MMTNGFYAGYDLPPGCACSLCISDLCWARALDQNDNEIFTVDIDAVKNTIIVCGGGCLG